RHAPCINDRAYILVRDSDGQVVVSVTVEVSPCEGTAEVIPSFRRIENRAGVLGPELSSSGGEEVGWGGRPIDHLDGSGVLDRVSCSQILVWSADRQVCVSVPVEVCGRAGRSKEWRALFSSGNSGRNVAFRPSRERTNEARHEGQRTYARHESPPQG